MKNTPNLNEPCAVANIEPALKGISQALANLSKRNGVSPCQIFKLVEKTFKEELNNLLAGDTFEDTFNDCSSCDGCDWMKHSNNHNFKNICESDNKADSKGET